MGRKTYPSGLMPADVVPVGPEKQPKGPDNLADRLEQMTGNIRSTPMQLIKVANYLQQFDDGRDLAGYFGVTDAFDAITRIRAREEVS